MRRFEPVPPPKELETWVSRPVCALCKGNGPFHRHHKRFRSHGGPDGAENLVLLCEVCHLATHGIRGVKHGFSCDVCPVLARDGCFFGERIADRPPTTPPPWDVTQNRS